jgi:hypothetical protein
MAGVRKVLVPQFLRSEPKFLPLSFLDSGDGGAKLQVLAGELVNVGAKPDVDETVDGRSFKWIFVEATGGQQVEKRKGFLSSEFLGPEDSVVPVSDGFQPFSPQVNKEDFANTCYWQATSNGTNPAYLYALAFALSGSQWSSSDVKTDDPADALAFGVFRFPKETWQHLISEPEATNILPDDIKFPDVQCIVAAILAAKSANLLKGKITDRGLSAVDLFLAHLFADNEGFGSKATDMILQAEKTDKTQSAETVIKAIYPETAVRTTFFKRNADIFRADRSATIEQALEVCATKLDSGFAEVRKLAGEVEADVSGGGIPSSSTGPILGGVGATGDSVAGMRGGIDRSRFSVELAQNPGLHDKIMRIAANEQGSHQQGTQAVLESMMNRAEVRGTSLEAQAKWHESEGGYYQQGNMGVSALENAFHRAILEQSFKNVLGGSNISNYATDNSSGSLAAGEIKSGRFLFCSTYGGETFSVPSQREQPQNARRWREWRDRLGTAGSEPSTSETEAIKPPSVMPGARLADSGKPPVAFVMHHTGPAGSVAGIVNDWRTHRPGIGTQYIMDREGVIHDVEKEFGYRGHGHVLPSATPQKYLRQGIVNPNIVGMEVMARDDKDVTTIQVEAAKRFIHENYPNTPVYGHGGLNPGHREASEGMTIVQAIRSERAQEEVQPK